VEPPFRLNLSSCLLEVPVHTDDATDDLRGCGGTNRHLQ
jgi:hypothetical protein